MAARARGPAVHLQRALALPRDARRARDRRRPAAGAARRLRSAPAWCARRARARATPSLAAAAAVVAAAAIHVAVDWDWELPAVTLPVLLVVAAALAVPRRAGHRLPGVSSASSLSVVVPAYNEERGIVGTVEQLRAGSRPTGATGRSSSSTTRRPTPTVSLLQPLLSDRVRLLENETNRGKGYSVKRGMLAARGDLRLHCDADCAPSLESLPTMLELIEGADVVTGSRLAEGAHVAPSAAAAAHRRAHVRAALPARAARADPRPLLRLQAVARRGGDRVLRPHPPRGLGVRRRGVRDGPRARLRDPRDRRRVDRPRGVAAVDARARLLRRARPAGRAAARAPTVPEGKARAAPRRDR